jgi:murein DD-endopeptidase MepM/ murein hydrolase activator NlpD
MTCSVHLARAAVTVGQHLDRGQLIAWSGYSGLDGFSTFPWGVPHVHLNVWLNGEPVDPFAHDGHASMWRAGALPTSPSADEPQAAWEESHYDETGVEQAIQACKTPSSRERLRSVEPLWRRAAEVIAEMNYYPTRFPERPFVYATREERRPTLDLPFSSSMFDRVVFVDDL